MNQSTTQRQLRISLIVSDLSSKGAGRWGGAIRPFLLAQALQTLGHQVKMFGLAYDENDSVPTEIEADFPIFSVPCPLYAGIGGTWRVLRQLLPRLDGDILYAVKLKPSSYGMGLLKKWLSHRPLLVDIDDWEMSWYGGDRWQYHWQGKQMAKEILKADGALRYADHPLYLKQMERWVHHADAITLHTQFIQKRFGGTYIPNGKDVHLFDPDRYDSQASRLKYGLADYQVLMFPGAPRPYKGVEDVLLALDRLNWPQLRLAIVGGSPYDDYDKHLREKWGRWLIQLPRSPVAQMPEIVSATDVIVVPQRNEPTARAQFPLKLTDGMAMAKPILATKVGDIPTILENTGYLVDSDSPEQLAAKIQWIFEHSEEAKTKGKAARERCIQHYSIEAMAAILEQILKEVLNGKRQA